MGEVICLPYRPRTFGEAHLARVGGRRGGKDCESQLLVSVVETAERKKRHVGELSGRERPESRWVVKRKKEMSAAIAPYRFSAPGGFNYLGGILPCIFASVGTVCWGQVAWDCPSSELAVRVILKHLTRLA